MSIFGEKVSALRSRGLQVGDVLFSVSSGGLADNGPPRVYTAKHGYFVRAVIDLVPGEEPTFALAIKLRTSGLIVFLSRASCSRIASGHQVRSVKVTRVRDKFAEADVDSWF